MPLTSSHAVAVANDDLAGQLVPTVAGFGGGSNVEPIVMKTEDGFSSKAPTSKSCDIVQRQVAKATFVNEEGDAKQASESLQPAPAVAKMPIEVFLESKSEDSSNHGSLGCSSSTLVGANIPVDKSDC